MALKGTLGDFSLTDILQLIGLQRKTGVLVLKRGETMVTIGFDTGRVVTAESSERTVDQRVGQLLVRVGKLTEFRLNQALEIQRDSLQRIGKVLVDRGWTDRESIQRQLQLQVSETIYSLFRWTDGEYDFRPDAEVEWDRELMVPIACEQLIMEGAQMADEWPQIERTIPSRNVVLRLTAEAEARLATVGSQASEDKGSVYENDIDFGFIPSDPLDEGHKGAPQLSPREIVVLRWIDGQRSALEVAELSELGLFDGFKVMAELVEQRLAEIAPTEGGDTAARPRRGLLEFALPGWVVGFVVAVLAAAGLAVAAADLANLFALPLPFEPAVPTLSSERMLADVTGLDRVRASASRARMARIDRALRAYYLSERAWPAALGELSDVGLIPAGLLKDPWGRPYLYTVYVWGYEIESTPYPVTIPPVEHRFSTLERAARIPARVQPTR